MAAINFFNQQLNYTLKNKTALRSWFNAVAENENYAIEELNYIFCDDAFLLEMNVHYLKHDTLTDVITFDNAIENKKIIGDIYISIERIKENAAKYKVTASNELHRVMVHGLLHLCGFKDKSPATKKAMTTKEDFYLNHPLHFAIG